MTTKIAGDAFRFSWPRSQSDLPELWRDLDRAVWRWVRAHGGDPLTALAAGWVSHAEGQGHSALPLSSNDAEGRPLLGPACYEALAQSPLVDTHAGEARPARPFVLDGDHLYLRRNHRDEIRVAEALVERRAAAASPVRALDDADLRGLFQGSWRDEEERQRAAVRQAPGRRLMVLTGGPGTGKTSTVLRMLLGLSREHEARTGPLPRLSVAAPTGKAAQRLSEALRQGAARLGSGEPPLDAAWASHLDGVLAAGSGTLHRLLGSRGRQGGFAFHAGERLPADIVVLDEASMLDLGLLRALLSALREEAVLVLVGDADQLSSVGTGSVMMDIVRALQADPRGDLVRLEHGFRADAALVPINEAVRAGDAQAFEAAFEQAASQRRGERVAARIHIVDTPDQLQGRLAAWAREWMAELEAVGIERPVPFDDGPGLASRLGLLRRQQLLCAQREGPFGAVQASTAIAARLRGGSALADWAGSIWYPGRAVIVLRNDPAARLYNGDVGLCLLVEDATGQRRLQVAFDPAADAAAAPGSGAAQADPAPVRLFDPAALPPHEDAFALTVHKSQGSEYARVAVLLPPDAHSPLLNRQTLYTGLSRARVALELWSSTASTAKALATGLQRHGRLAERIAAAGP
ncbi:exodeoxyribonuclease V subunit alpha [Silanimonas sp.]|uniref:exodeoxyribonuclease V subunit alpha n=1 Tax=Silanimonas sp. TaxID=1929290 RepID=UPI001BC75022|nr:exodeoxyribonuclease V subunit alpha [Silanimonas sp.]MBS3895753.1 exodeoxyribonuclease V subunit alpha [Silanimonas sp.]MBS3924737.1 exodeoxyribonuclease V subunit alpha [Xanthomonadaceae bacterium]